MSKEKIVIFDTTLRDGEQAPGASLTAKEKQEIAYQLERLGVDVIEAGFPIASPGDFKGVDIISKSLKKSSVCALARCIKKDVVAAAQALKKAKRPRIHVFLATSKIHLKYKFKKAESEIISIAKQHVKLARSFCSDIEFSPEDATRTDRNFLFKVIEEAIKAGAKTINIPDTVGYSYPNEMSSLISDIVQNVPNINKVTIAVHCHDDLGMAVANSLSAVISGARQVHCTVNGIGERAGNASLEEIVMALRTRKDVFKNFYTDINTKEIYKTSKMVSSLTGFVIAPNKAIVGANSFRHESGIHQDAVLKERTTYEIMNPKDIGFSVSNIVLGKHSGRHALSKRLSDLGFSVNKKQLDLIFERFKDLADKKKEVFDDDLIALFEEEIKLESNKIRCLDLSFEGGTDLKPKAKVKLSYQGKNLEEVSTGDGPVDACFKAIDKMLKIKPKLMRYKLEALTQGKDALGKAHVELKLNNKLAIGVGSSTDIVEASVKGYVDAVNRLI